jgi:hypothetical protein
MAALILLLFLIGSNKAWLNVRPGFTPTCKASQTFPFMWQYDMDAYWEFLSAAKFPEVFKTYSLRVNRPLYPALAHGLGLAYHAVCWPVKKLSNYQAAFLGYVTLKLLMFLTFALIMYHLCLRWFSGGVSLLAVCLLLSQRHFINAISTFHTYELETISPAIIIFLLVLLKEKYSAARVSLFSLAAGLLLLGRQNYAIYLAIILFGLYKRRFKDVALSLVACLLPLGLWLGYLHVAGIPYIDHEVSGYSLPLWLAQANSGFFGWVELVGITLHNFGGAWEGILLLGVFWLGGRHAQGWRLGRDQAVFLALCVLMVYAQFVASNKGHGYMTSDLWFLAYPLAAAGIFQLMENWRPRARNWALVSLIIWRVAWDTLRWVDTPWVHPLKQ